jgi:hypothetical protein
VAPAGFIDTWFSLLATWLAARKLENWRTGSWSAALVFCSTQEGLGMALLSVFLGIALPASSGGAALRTQALPA